MNSSELLKLAIGSESYKNTVSLYRPSMDGVYSLNSAWIQMKFLETLLKSKVRGTYFFLHDSIQLKSAADFFLIVTRVQKWWKKICFKGLF